MAVLAIAIGAFHRCTRPRTPLVILMLAVLPYRLTFHYGL